MLRHLLEKQCIQSQARSKNEKVLPYDTGLCFAEPHFYNLNFKGSALFGFVLQEDAVTGSHYMELLSQLETETFWTFQHFNLYRG